jgi:hypothetical protein
MVLERIIPPAARIYYTVPITVLDVNATRLTLHEPQACRQANEGQKWDDDD